MSKVPAAKCIFCGGGNLSREHVWSEWLSGMLLPTEGRYLERSSSRGPKATAVDRRKDEQGRLSGVKLRVVCKKCNNEWMNQEETAVRPYLTPLVQGHALMMTKAARSALRAWICMKLMVIDRTPTAGAVFLTEERAAFMADRSVPAHLDIWLLHCGDGNWQLGLEQAFAPLVVPDKEPKGPLPNTAIWVWGIGQLLVVAFYHRDAPGFDIGDETAVRLHPDPADVRRWPPQGRTPAADAYRFANIYRTMEEAGATFDPDLS